MPHVSVGILACNNEAIIADCLQSVAWADDIFVVLDTRSIDRTASVARAFGARVIPHRFENFAAQREFGLSLARGEWLFYVDSDERATRHVEEEIRHVIRDDAISGWWIPRRNIIWGKEIRHGGWYPDYQLRLLKVGRAHYNPKWQVHEIVDLAGEAGYLKNPLIHYNYRTFEEFRRKQQQYVPYEARIRYQEGKRPKPWTYLSQPLREFWRRYVTLQGYKDGIWGLVLCSLVAYYYGFLVTVQLGKLWHERQGRAANARRKV
ncbi:MAG: glycosyltransferase family 2 protein [Chloroflexota bacterium]|nr:glycosyltransferase family 2 protein [Chloroflexota bacterium]